MIRLAALTLTLGLLTVGRLCSAQPVASAADERVDRLTQKALAADAHTGRGKELFQRNCVPCHGIAAAGDPDRGIPALAGQRFAYLIRQLANFSGKERDNATMHEVTHKQEIRNPQAWADIAGYLNHLTATSPPQFGPSDDIQLGSAIFHEQCASCHGADAGGDAEGFVPSLRHQHYGYLLSQMHQLGSGNRHNVDEGLVLFLRGFDERDMSATASYLSHLTGIREKQKKLRDNGVAVN